MTRAAEVLGGPCETQRSRVRPSSACCSHASSAPGVWWLTWRWAGNHPINSYVPERCGGNFKSIISKLITQDRSFSTCCKITVWWMSQNFSNEKSASVQVMAWCHQASSYYLNQCWPSFKRLYGITRPRWVNALKLHLIYTTIHHMFLSNNLISRNV